MVLVSPGSANPGIGREAVRAVRPGEPSSLRELARRPVDRAAAIRRWVAEYGDRHSIEVWAWFHPGSGDWELDFERVDGGPAVKDVKAAIAAHRHLRGYPIAVATEAGAAIRWARAMREPGAAVILDGQAELRERLAGGRSARRSGRRRRTRSRRDRPAAGLHR
jgi:hypothetical protein